MTTTALSYSDQPARLDELGFAPSAAALHEIIAGEDTLADTPLTIGIYGAWGSGKTSLMQMLYTQLDPDNLDAPCIPVWFDAWRYNQETTLWRALLLNVVEAMRRYLTRDEAWLRARMAQQGREINELPTDEALKGERDKLDRELDDLVASLYRNVEREEPGEIEIDWPEAGKVATRLVVRAGFAFVPALAPLTKFVEAAQGKVGEGEDLSGLWDVFHRERTKVYKDQVQSLDQFQERLRTLIEALVSGRGRRLVVFIDDLDRCLPEQAVGVLEAIKVFLDIPGCIFVLGVDREIIERGIRVRYKEFALDADAARRAGAEAAVFPIAERDYLEKIVQIPFELPPLDKDKIIAFLQARLRKLNGLENEAEVIAEVMTAGLLPNPRKVKRTLNTFRLLRSLSATHGRTAPPALLAALVVIQSSAAPIYERIVKDPPMLPKLEKIARGLDSDPTLQALLNEHPRISAMLNQTFFHKLREEELRNLIFLTRPTQDRLNGG